MYNANAAQMIGVDRCCPRALRLQYESFPVLPHFCTIRNLSKRVLDRPFVVVWSCLPFAVASPSTLNQAQLLVGRSNRNVLAEWPSGLFGFLTPHRLRWATTAPLTVALLGNAEMIARSARNATVELWGPLIRSSESSASLRRLRVDNCEPNASAAGRSSEREVYEHLNLSPQKCPGRTSNWLKNRLPRMKIAWYFTVLYYQALHKSTHVLHLLHLFRNRSQQ